MITDADFARALTTIGVLLVAAHTVGALFERFRQPRVIGEILGGLLVGPTVLGAFAPDAVHWMFGAGPHAAPIGLLQQFGLLLLLFCSGSEIRLDIGPAQRRHVSSIAALGMLIPAAAAAGLFTLFPLHEYWGANGGRASFLIVTCIAFAVTSIPVISRIMSDLGILGTIFARTVLGVAVIEDIVVYVALAVAVALATPSSTTEFGLAHSLGLSAGSNADIALHVGSTVVLLVAVVAFGRPALALAARLTRSVLRTPNPLTIRLMVLIAITLLALVMGVETYLAAFAAGIAVGRVTGTPAGREHHDVLKRFSFAFFVPIYFALVGANLNLRRGFDVAFFVGFIALACAVKGASVYLGARVSGHAAQGALDLAVALNARGGPGIVVATVAYGAHIINEQFYAVLVLLAIISSLIAGSYLARRLRPAFATDHDQPVEPTELTAVA